MSQYLCPGFEECFKECIHGKQCLAHRNFLVNYRLELFAHVCFCVNLEKGTFLGWLVVLNVPPGQNFQEDSGIKCNNVMLILSIQVHPDVLSLGHPDVLRGPSHLRGNMSPVEVLAVDSSLFTLVTALQAARLQWSL